MLKQDQQLHVKTSEKAGVRKGKERDGLNNNAARTAQPGHKGSSQVAYVLVLSSRFRYPTSLVGAGTSISHWEGQTWRQMSERKLRSYCYRGKTREGSCRNRLRYAAISVATVLKSFTLSRRMSFMICFRPAM